MLGKALVDERVVGRKQIEQAAILAKDARHEKRRLGRERLPQRFVEREDHRIGLHGLDVTQLQPLTGKVRHQRVGARILDHPPHLLFQHRSVSQPPVFGEIEQLAIGNAAPEEKRQARGEVDVGDATGISGPAKAGPCAGRCLRG